MSTALYRLGRTAAARPWAVIGAWLIVSIAVIAASSTFGRELEDSFEVPGLDSQEAIDLLAEAESDRAGLFALDLVDGGQPVRIADRIVDAARLGGTPAPFEVRDDRAVFCAEDDGGF